MDDVVDSKQITRNPLKLSPNPLTINELDINGLNASLVDIEIYTLAGKRIFFKTKHPAQESLHLGSLKEGVYVVRILNRDTGDAYYDKLLIMN